MISRIGRTITALALLGLVAAGCGDDDEPDAAGDTATTDEMAEDEMGDVLEVAAAEGDLNTFLEALEAAGTMEGLHTSGPFTLFAPTDEAFTAYIDESGMSQTEIFGDAEALRRIVDNHVVNMSEMADQVMAMNGQSFTTSAGLPLQVTVDGDTVMVGDATVERYDIEASNGVVHVIDEVLVPSEA